MIFFFYADLVYAKDHIFVAQRNCCTNSIQYYYLLIISSYRLLLRKLSFDLASHNLNSLVVSFIHIVMHFWNLLRYIVELGKRDHAYPIILEKTFMIFFIYCGKICVTKLTILTISKCTVQ